MYETAKYIHGPYTRKDGRKHVCIVWQDGRKQTVSYPKFLVECDRGTPLKENETVDHINRDFTDNRLENLRVVDRSIHGADDAKRIKSQSFVCSECSEVFILNGKQVHDAFHNRKQGKAGPFCSRSCAGKYGKAIQTGQKEKQDGVSIVKEYYRKDKCRGGGMYTQLS